MGSCPNALRISSAKIQRKAIGIQRTSLISKAILNQTLILISN